MIVLQKLRMLLTGQCLGDPASYRWRIGRQHLVMIFLITSMRMDNISKVNISLYQRYRYQVILTRYGEMT